MFVKVTCRTTKMLCEFELCLNRFSKNFQESSGIIKVILSKYYFFFRNGLMKVSVFTYLSDIERNPDCITAFYKDWLVIKE